MRFDFALYQYVHYFDDRQCAPFVLSTKQFALVLIVARQPSWLLRCSGNTVKIFPHGYGLKMVGVDSRAMVIIHIEIQANFLVSHDY